MKNNFFIIIFYLFLLSKSFALEEFTFETSEIEIINNGKFIYAKEGKAISSDKNLEIDAANFEYDKNSKLLKAFNGFAIFKKDNLKIVFDEMTLNQNDAILKAKKNVEIYELEKDFIIQTDLIVYDKKTNTIRSITKSILKDRLNNKIISEKFEYELNKNILKVENANLTDFENNNFNIKLAYINTSSNKLYGKDIDANLNNTSFNKDNEPRLKGKSVTIDNNTTEITKGVFTTCKRREDCPPWQLSAKKITHDRKNQIIKYDNAWLQVYDTPIIYFPKFFHPDPTVKRQSGFLVPTIKNSPNSDSYLNLPYFHAISLNQDITLTPRLYSDDKFLLQSEYRQENKNSSHIADIGFFAEKDKNSKNHFFYNYNKQLTFNNFEFSTIKLNLEKVSNDTYLRGNQLTSPIISDYDVLESALALNLYSDQLSIDTELLVYEDLTKPNNDRYEFILPKVDIEKKIKNNTDLNGNFLFKSSNLIKNYQTNIFEKININDFIFNSNPYITRNGFYNDYNFIIKNVNSDTQNSEDFKENDNYYVSGLWQFNSSLPLVKESNNYQNVLKPKLTLKLSPENTKDISDEEVRLDVNNIYNLNRLSANDTLEGGVSLAYGNDFSIYNKNKTREVFALKLANNIRFKQNNDLPKNDQIGLKTSNIFGEISYSPNEFLTTKYNTSLKNNFSDSNYENIITELSINNFVTTFDYLNENNTKEKNSYLQNTTKYALNSRNSLIFSTRENKKLDLTEYYNLIYQYKNDCLAASIEYNKDYYSDRDIKPEENIFIKLTIIPFGETSSPNLRK
tara:strand:- start:3219 stop:5600 length:2382 start_codon:yes stop_codon:yes gene_type:complete